MAGNDEASSGDEFFRSEEPAKNGYGQNGFQGASSDLPGQHTVMDRDFGLESDPNPDAGDWQTRKVSAEPYPTHPGMKAAPAPVVIQKTNFHRAVQRTSGKSFQRG